MVEYHTCTYLLWSWLEIAPCPSWSAEVSPADTNRRQSEGTPAVSHCRSQPLFQLQASRLHSDDGFAIERDPPELRTLAHELRHPPADDVRGDWKSERENVIRVSGGGGGRGGMEEKCYLQWWDVCPKLLVQNFYYTDRAVVSSSRDHE